MLKHLIAGIKRGLRLHHPGRSLLILPDDIFLVSFPKSGNTWTRFLLGNLTHPEQPATFANIRRLIPDPSGTTKKDFDLMPRPRIIKSRLRTSSRASWQARPVPTGRGDKTSSLGWPHAGTSPGSSCCAMKT
jgi:hypothetical protein